MQMRHSDPVLSRNLANEIVKFTKAHHEIDWDTKEQLFSLVTKRMLRNSL